MILSITPFLICFCSTQWNKIEHRLFCHITQNWRGRPLTSRTAIVELIAATTTKTGLTVRCELDKNTYAQGVKVSDAKMVVIYRRNIAWTCLTNLYLRQCS